MIKMKKGYKYAIRVAIVIILLLLIVPIPIPINKTINTVEIKPDDKTYCVPVRITINGTYIWRAIAADTFRGDIKLDTYELTQNNSLVQTKNIPALTFQGSSATLDYGEWMKSEIFGKINVKPFFRQFVIQVFEIDKNGGGSWTTDGGRCIVSNSTNRDEAVKIIRTFSNDSLMPLPVNID